MDIMPSKYRRRSTLSWFIWGTACLVLVALLAWQFEWFPRQKVNDLVEKENSVAGISASMPTPDDPEIFQQQPEPEFGSENPFAETNAQTATPPLEHDPFGDSRLRQAGFDDVAAKSDPLRNSQSNTAEWLNHSGQNFPQRTTKSSRTDGSGNFSNSFSNNTSKPLTWEGAANSHPPAEFFRNVDRLTNDGETFDAHHELSTLYWKHPEWRRDIQNRIDATAEAIYFSSRRHFIDPYVVRYDDNLTKIANRYKLSWQYLSTLNNVHPKSIRESDRLKVHNGPFSAIIDLSDFELIVYHHGYYVRKYRIGIGKDNATPVGKFKVLSKIVNPQYTRRDERTGRNFVIEGDDSSNPLGERWIDIGNHFGIHGTIDPDSIGKAVSKGCIRLRNSDVEEVFDFLIVGSEVVIRK